MTFRGYEWEPASQCEVDYATLMPQTAGDAWERHVKMGYGQGDEKSVTLSDLSRLVRRFSDWIG